MVQQYQQWYGTATTTATTKGCFKCTFTEKPLTSLWTNTFKNNSNAINKYLLSQHQCVILGIKHQSVTFNNQYSHVLNIESIFKLINIYWIFIYFQYWINIESILSESINFWYVSQYIWDWINIASTTFKWYS